MQRVRRRPGIINAETGKIKKDHAHVLPVDRGESDVAMGGGGGYRKSSGVDVIRADGESCRFR